jgi:hypothetical protein
MTLALIVAEVLVLVSFARWLVTQEPGVLIGVGVHMLALALIIAAIFLIREKAEEARLWPEDLDDVWPEDPEPEPVEEGSGR